MHPLFSSRSLAIAAVAGLIQAPTQSLAQVPSADVLSSDYNSTFSLSPAQIAAAQLSPELANNINIIVRGDRSGLANGGPRQDDFYTLPARGKGRLQPGQVLKVQRVTDSKPFAISPGTTLSRILYTSETLNGTVVPASAFVLWPFESRRFGSDKAPPVVLWTHGTSGFFADAAPSSYRSLLYGDMAPFSLAQSGYIVVAPDYAGLGVGKSWDGTDIPHQYLFAPSQARDAIFALQAARTAFGPRLSGKFAVAGHSQGGGVAWGTAEYLATLQQKGKSLNQGLRDIVKTYVGTIAMAPVTDAWTLGAFGIASASLAVEVAFPDFTLDKWFTPLGVARLRLFKEIQGTATVAQQMFLSEPQDAFLKPNWANATYHADAYAKLGNPGGKPFAGPMMVTQGTKDVFVAEPVTAVAVDKSNKASPRNSLTYVTTDGYGHTPAISALRLTWMTWLEDRFEGKKSKAGRVNVHKESIEGSAQAGNSYPQWAAGPEYGYLNLGAV